MSQLGMRYPRKHAQQSVHPTSGSLRVFKHFSWLGVVSVKLPFSPPAQPPVTQTVGCHTE
jgi:hypothetical protein